MRGLLPVKTYVRRLFSVRTLDDYYRKNIIGLLSVKHKRIIIGKIMC